MGKRKITQQNQTEITFKNPDISDIVMPSGKRHKSSSSTAGGSGFAAAVARDHYAVKKCPV